ncbi:MAG: carboxypeptidase regulatory-like domain-containing protein [Planctomycetes bacterium]|nr:carboxypeptidase regulatory-like domain-containing protein [Planctomycetota bacterium]
MNKTLLALLLAALAFAVLCFALFAFFSPAPAPMIEQATPAARVESDSARPSGAKPAEGPAALLPADSATPTAAAADQREARAQDLSATLPPEKLCRLLVQVDLPEGAEADEGAEILVLTRARHARTVEVALARLQPGEKLPEDLLARERAHSPSMVIPLERRESPVTVMVRGRFLHGPAQTAVDISGAEASTRLAVEIGACVRGRLIPPAAGPEGLDLAGTEIQLFTDPMANQGVQTGASQTASVRRETASLGDGSFEFRGVPPSKNLALDSSSEHFAASHTVIAELVAGRVTEVNVPLGLGGTLAGRVTDSAGAGIADATLEVRGKPLIMGFGGQELRETKSGADGAFELRAVAAGKVTVDVSKEGFLNSSKSLELAEGGRVTDIALVLSSGERIAGTVRLPDGTPCADAHVDVTFDSAGLQGMGAMNARFGAAGSARSDAQGAFNVSGLGKGPFTVSAWSIPKHAGAAAGEPGPGKPEGLDLDTNKPTARWSARVDDVKPGTLDLALVLQAPAGIAGRVVDDVGAVVSECTVVLSNKPRNAFIPNSPAREVAMKDAEGRFTAEGLAAGEYVATARAATGPLSPGVEFSLPRDPALGELVLTLPRPATVSGRVLLPDGRPASLAKVSRLYSLAELSSGQNPAGGPSVATDADGQFTLDSLPMGALNLQASKEGYAPSEGIPVSVVPGGLVRDVVLQLRIGGTITGEAFNSQGKPNAGARILGQMPDLRYGQKWSTADSAGKFVLEHLGPGQWQVMTFGDGGEAGEDEGAAAASFMKDLKLAMATVKDGETVHVVLGAPPKDPVQVTGRVLAAGQPVPGAMISFIPSDSGKPGAGMAGLALASAEKSGAYEINLQQSGQYLITVQKITDQGGQQSVEFSRAIPNQPEVSLDLELPLGAITGTVRNSAGEPVKGARISLGVDGAVRAGTLTGGRFSELTTDDRGEYLLEWLSPGRYTVAAGGASFVGLPGAGEPLAREVRDGVRVDEGERVTLDFRLRDACTLAGRVVDSAGRPVSEASLFVRDEAGRPIDRFSMTTTDGAGRFTQKGLGAGRYTVHARNATLVSDEASVVLSEAETAEVELHLEDGTMLVVTLTDADGGAIEASCRVLDAQGRQVNGVYSLADIMAVMAEGGFDSKRQRIGPLPRGKYTIEATGPDGNVKTKEITITGQAEKKVTLKLTD